MSPNSDPQSWSQNLKQWRQYLLEIMRGDTAVWEEGDEDEWGILSSELLTVWMEGWKDSHKRHR